MESISLLTSLFAIAISLLALFWSRKQYLLDSEIKMRQELSSFILLAQRLDDSFYLMERERNKTGIPMDDGELAIFERHKEMLGVVDETRDELKSLLEKENLKYDKMLMNHLFILKSHSEGIIEWCERRFDRFSKFNENKIVEMKEKVEEMQEIAKFVTENYSNK
ncbi:hypothetical protein [Amphritea pacifica]|uniref:hypothetical protein n=1 Tax=Amphritea pacifica TaxID=2811233 RepID=UPI001966B6CB|nr:hypothetical protein [Amphritea pacifica]MBN1008881.1 hypothetical protein [Amphritea pacifica]